MKFRKKKKKLGRAWKVLIAIAVVVLILALPLMSLAEVIILRFSGRSDFTELEEMREFMLDEVEFDTVAFEQEHDMEKFYVPSSVTYGYNIPVFHLKGKYKSEESDVSEQIGFVVMAHGSNASHLTVYPESQAFLDMGIDVWFFDERKYGESTFEYSTFGYLESADVLDVFTFATDSYQDEYDPLKSDEYWSERWMGVWGQSMGAAAVMNALGYKRIRDEIDFCIIDCPMGAMEDLTHAPSIQNRIASYEQDVLFDYSFDDQNPYDKLQNYKGPVFLITAEDDEMIPEKTTSAIRIIISNSDFGLHEYVGKNSLHANVWFDHPDEYELAIRNFIVGLD